MYIGASILILVLLLKISEALYSSCFQINRKSVLCNSNLIMCILFFQRSKANYEIVLLARIESKRDQGAWTFLEKQIDKAVASLKTPEHKQTSKAHSSTSCFQRKETKKNKGK